MAAASAVVWLQSTFFYTRTVRSQERLANAEIDAQLMALALKTLDMLVHNELAIVNRATSRVLPTAAGCLMSSSYLSRT